jgi:hypothetical protein
VSDAVGTVIYLAGHGSKSRPRLIELQYQRILRYRRALLTRREIKKATPTVFIDLRLPGYGLGHVTLNEVPRFVDLHAAVQSGRFDTVFIDLDETREGLTPDYESAFVRSLIEDAGATVLNAFSDDKGAFLEELKARCGQNARDDDITDGSDFVCFFPSLTAEIAVAALRRDIHTASALQSVPDRIEGLRRLRPHLGGGVPFIEDRLPFDWKKQ